MAQYEICGVIQRWLAKRMMGRRDFPVVLVNEIASEMGINPSLVEMVLMQNGYITR